MLRNEGQANHTALGRYDAKKGAICAIRVPRDGVMGVRPRNKEQSIALDVLLDDSIRLVALMGKAGTGKTLLARAIASNMECNFLKVVASAIVDKYIGESARLIREMFGYARENQPCIIFMGTNTAHVSEGRGEGTLPRSLTHNAQWCRLSRARCGCVGVGVPVGCGRYGSCSRPFVSDSVRTHAVHPNPRTA